MDIKIGCDPEFFVKKDGQYVSAFGLINGTKYNPQLVDGGAIQVDGMALEFNIDPAKTAEEFSGRIQNVLKQFREIIPSEYEFAFDPVAQFGEEYIRSQPPEATELGCTPDFNAYTGETNPKPNASVPFRTASGHIHIGWTEDVDPYDPEHFEACCMLVKELDHSLACLEKFWDSDTQRKELYGAYGAFRPKPYGVEYRVLSNAWVRDPDLMQFIFKVVNDCFDHLRSGKKNYMDEWTGYMDHGYRNDWEFFDTQFRPFATKQLAQKFADRFIQIRDERRRKEYDEMHSWATAFQNLAPTPAQPTITSFSIMYGGAKTATNPTKKKAPKKYWVKNDSITGFQH
jgi:hypothetical protein